MASQEAHDWWADVQDEREALGRGRRPVAVWADEDFDLVPAHVVGRPPVSDELAPRRAARRGHRFVRAGEPVEREVDDWSQPAERAVDDWSAQAPADLLQPPAPERPVDEREMPRRIVLESAVEAADADTEELPRRVVLERAGEIDHVMPPRGHDVVRIKGRPQDRRAPLPARAEPRRPSRTARELVEHQPDRIMFWATALGFLLILLAFATG